ncbi:MAG TPA: HDOD domain-containing protein [Terracidiphilus sp.]|nr:HDOD domain-containing protein [Terracidiphilus sp.]
MKRILFVDDDPNVLDGLERMLRHQSREWEMAFVGSGKEALALLESRPFDVIVADVLMPEMDGAALLDQVQGRFPGVLRIVLSGHFERDAALKAAGVAHRYLAKPCCAAGLVAAIEGLCRSAALLPDLRARCVVGSIGSLPGLPNACADAIELLREPEGCLDQVCRAIERDVGMTAQLLQVAASPLFGNATTTISEAVGHLGFDGMRRLLISRQIFESFVPAPSVPGFSLDDFELHCWLTAKIAARLPAPADVVSQAVLAGALHDIGKLVLAARLPIPFEQALAASRRHRPLHEAEKEAIGASHAEVGAYLLSLWGLPAPVVDAVFRHHQPASGAESAGLNLLAITHIADGLAREQAPNPSGAMDAPLDLDYLARLKVTGQLEEWRTIAREIAGSARVPKAVS